MKKIITILTIGAAVALTAQVGIGVNSPDSTAMMEAASTEKGFLPPRMTTAQRDAINGGNPSAGLVIYNLDVHCLEFFNATEWVSFCNGSNSETLNYRLGGSSSDQGNFVQQTSDGGYIVAGNSESTASGDISGTNNGGPDAWIVKLDASGEVEWDKMIGGSDYDDIYFIQQTSDGGYIMTGGSQSSASGDIVDTSNGYLDSWIIKLDASGNIQWNRLLGGNSAEYFLAVRQAPDGGYIAVGSSSSSTSGDVTDTNNGAIDFWIVKLDSSGNITWSRLYGGEENDEARGVQLTSDGGYIVTGWSYSSASGDIAATNQGRMDAWVIKLNASGDLQWEKLFGGNDNDEAISVQQASDGGYILAGTSESSSSGDISDVSNGDADGWVIKLDASGNMQWNKLLGGSDWDGFSSIGLTTDGGYIVGGSSGSSLSGDVSGTNYGSGDLWAVKLDVSGNQQWDKLLGGTGNEYGTSAQQTSDGGYVVLGSSAHNSAGTGDQAGIISIGEYDYWLIMLDQNGNTIEP
ncbi:hypothetical protein [Moheibacter sediminis]|uniref:Uncharacterized protein n=1 Tax=Moheibacter sediminis TaxID=1434700 RepID=A0A1W2ARU3_9FLAO|nr:hypothetical protein [Moheibacter sediminis]SMC63161.1 hypothetical protein SAMN06296427_10521 [Moheibacter sediminis]